MPKPRSASKEKEAFNQVGSQLNGCRYCPGAHTTLVKLNGFWGDEILQLRGGHATDARLAALVALTQEVSENKGHVSPEILDAFFAAGYAKGNRVDVILQVSGKQINHLVQEKQRVLLGQAAPGCSRRLFWPCRWRGRGGG